MSYISNSSLSLTLFSRSWILSRTHVFADPILETSFPKSVNWTGFSSCSIGGEGKRSRIFLMSFRISPSSSCMAFAKFSILETRLPNLLVQFPIRKTVANIVKPTITMTILHGTSSIHSEIGLFLYGFGWRRCSIQGFLSDFNGHRRTPPRTLSIRRGSSRLSPASRPLRRAAVSTPQPPSRSGSSRPSGSPRRRHGPLEPNP